MYQEELKALKEYTEEELQQQYDRLRQGEEEAVASMVEAHLNRVAALAEEYRDRGVLLEDLIQEGNLELMTCVSMLCGNQEVLDYGKAIDHAVRSRLIELVDEAIAGSGQPDFHFRPGKPAVRGYQGTGRRVWQSGHH